MRRHLSRASPQHCCCSCFAYIQADGKNRQAIRERVFVTSCGTRGATTGHDPIWYVFVWYDVFTYREAAWAHCALTASAPEPIHGRLDDKGNNKAVRKRRTRGKATGRTSALFDPTSGFFVSVYLAEIAAKFISRVGILRWAQIE